MSFQDKLVNAITRFTNFKFVKCMQQGIVGAMNATMIGSIFMLLMIPPFPADSTFALAVAWREFAAANAAWLNLGYQIGLNAAGFYILIGMVNAVCKEEKAPLVDNLVISIMAFIILQCGFLADGGLDIGFGGSKGMMAALVIGYVVPECNIWLQTHGIQIKLPDSVPPFVAEPIKAIISDMIVMAGVVAIKLILAQFGFTVGSFINGIFAPLFAVSDSFVVVMLYCILVRILWFFGLHGNNIAGSVVNPILTANLVANAEAIAAGQEAPYIFTSAFQNWTTTGILAIVIATMIFGKSKQLKAMSKISLVPALFNIGEPTTFGLPLVLNFDIFVPYLLVFALNGAFPYFAIKMGLMNTPYLSLPFTIPAIIKVGLMSMDIRAVVVYLAMMVTCILVMAPGIRRYDKKLLEAEASEIEA